MIYTISSECLSVSINTLGAEMTSLKDINGHEFLWSGNASIWKGQAPNLFPFVGKLKDGKYQYNDKDYCIEKHGFARTSEFTVVTKTSSSITYCLSSTELSKASYPFDFKFYITYQLIDNTLAITYRVVNLMDVDMPFSIGAHPAFACNWHGNENIEDYYLEFDQAEQLSYQQFIDNGLSHLQNSQLGSTNKIMLTKQIFDKDALIFNTLQSKAITLKAKHSNNNIRVEFPKFTYLGLWSKPKAPYVCIEPWFGVDDYEDATGLLIDKAGIEIIGGGEQFQSEFRVIINSIPNN